MRDSKQEIERLRRQIAAIEPLRLIKHDSPEFRKWGRDTEVVIEKTFGQGTRHIKDFTDIHYRLFASHSGTPDSAFQDAYLKGLDSAALMLQSFAEELSEYGVTEDHGPIASSAIDVVCSHLRRFHLVARQLRSRHGGRSTLEVKDEYDVQDLLHALLQLDFEDIRDEEWTPSYAGGSARMDFLLKDVEVVLEAKKTRKGLGVKEIGEQLIIDTEKYRAHPSCKTLICFVYDPEGLIANPAALEHDLSGDKNGVAVKVLVIPKGA
jgi:hypothetical protein